ncbi:MAG: isoprenylcysteine carboxylmethyltransferase family protein [Solirubrobacterales bacterium]|nr:isoprenylcysteine carboxylmethyltransferase family protein [Solirubrobacterales bacterium]
MAAPHRRARPPLPARFVTGASAVFFLLGPGLEAGLGPWLLTGGWESGDDLPAQPLCTVLGAVLIAAGVTVLLQCFVAFVRDGRGTPTPAVPTGRLVVTGAYRHVRNPMYVATAAVVAGQALVLARPILLVAAAVYVATLALTGRRWEEPALRARFGAAYDAYREAVPAWCPRLRPWTG